MTKSDKARIALYLQLSIDAAARALASLSQEYAEEDNPLPTHLDTMRGELENAQDAWTASIK